MRKKIYWQVIEKIYNLTLGNITVVGLQILSLKSLWNIIKLDLQKKVQFFLKPNIQTRNVLEQLKNRSLKFVRYIINMYI